MPNTQIQHPLILYFSEFRPTVGFIADQAVRKQMGFPQNKSTNTTHSSKLQPRKTKQTRQPKQPKQPKNASATASIRGKQPNDMKMSSPPPSVEHVIPRSISPCTPKKYNYLHYQQSNPEYRHQYSGEVPYKRYEQYDQVRSANLNYQPYQHTKSTMDYVQQRPIEKHRPKSPLIKIQRAQVPPRSPVKLERRQTNFESKLNRLNAKLDSYIASTMNQH